MRRSYADGDVAIGSTDAIMMTATTREQVNMWIKPGNLLCRGGTKSEGSPWKAAALAVEPKYDHLAGFTTRRLGG